VNSLISLHHLLLDNETYFTEFKVDSAILNVQEFSVKKLREEIRMDKQLEHYLWKESIPSFARLFEATMRPLADLEEDKLYQILTFSEFRRIMPG